MNFQDPRRSIRPTSTRRRAEAGPGHANHEIGVQANRIFFWNEDSGIQATPDLAE
jgi:hypothetical protein